MTKFLLGTTALVLMGVSAASAADLRPRAYTKAPAMMAPIFSWTGFYAGINAGYGFSENDTGTTTGQAGINVTNVTTGARPGSIGARTDGFIGGGQMGYNWQFAPSWVFGLEADIAYTDFRTTSTVLGSTGLSNNYSKGLNYLGTARGRIGYAVDKTLFYATGGLAYGEVRNGADFFGPAGQLQFTGRDTSLRTGYTVGGGIEHAFAPNWTAKAEYLYYDLGRDTVNVAVVPGSGGGGTGYNTSFKNDGHVIRAGLNYKFSGGLFPAY
jgi:outer membrane immunogenic protein